MSLTTRHAARAFTVVEVLVAVLAILVFFGFAVAVSEGSNDAARDHRAQGAVSSVLSTQVLLFERDGAFLTQAGELAEVNSTFTYLPSTSPSDGPERVSVAANAGAVGAAVMSGSGDCWLGMATIDGAARGTTYGQVPESSTTACTGLVALTELTSAPGSGGGWSNPKELG